MPREGGFMSFVQEAVENRLGAQLVDSGQVERLEEAAKEGFALRRELDLLGWNVLDYLSGNPQEVKYEERRKMAQQARMVWASDPQAGAAVDLSNDFVLGRGIQKPKCKDEKVQEVVDEAWEDPDNKLVLTSFQAQVALNTDLELQSNVFLILFDDGDDGRVKLGILEHDGVEDVVRDPANRLRILYYVARHRKIGWDFANDRPKAVTTDGLGEAGRPKVRYYAHWQNVEIVEEETGNREADEELPKPPPNKMGDGLILHMAINRTTEMAFGVPTMRRLVRWYTAYNDFMKARVDMAQAAAAFIMKRNVKGTPGQLARMAAKAVSREGAETGDKQGPRAASILNENDAVSHDSMRLDSGAGNAQTDGQMIRSQISAATRWPQSYYGDPSSSNLATATSLELPVLKHVEARQEVLEGVIRSFVDRVIEKAVDSGRLDKYADPEEPDPNDPNAAQDAQQQGPPAFGAPDLGAPMGAPQNWQQQAKAQEGYGEEQTEDEEQTERDLSYDFSMPNPLKRAMGDLVTAVSTIAKTFDPNNTNPELSRTLLAVCLGEGLELDDPQGAVDDIFPKGYEDPAVAAAQQAADQQAQMGGMPPGAPPGAQGANGQQFGQGNPYGGPMRSTPPEMMQAAALAHGVDLGLLEGFDGLSNDELISLQARLPDGPLKTAALALSEARFADLPEALQLQTRGRQSDLEKMLGEMVEPVIGEVVTGLLAPGTNGNGNGHVTY